MAVKTERERELLQCTWGTWFNRRKKGQCGTVRLFCLGEHLQTVECSADVNVCTDVIRLNAADINFPTFITTANLHCTEHTLQVKRAFCKDANPRQLFLGFCAKKCLLCPDA